uniref:Uncharacterized protein n=1 Tax=Globodera rostochiensis TaxID=31243 RepID=A0A914H8R0_GLORO
MCNIASIYAKQQSSGTHIGDKLRTVDFSPKFEHHHKHHKHRLRRAVIRICVDFNRQPIPCKWETEAQLRRKFLACHMSIITMPFCHRTVPKIAAAAPPHKRATRRGRYVL